MGLNGILRGYVTGIFVEMYTYIIKCTWIWYAKK